MEAWRTFRSFPDCFPLTEQCVLAWAAPGCTKLPGILHHPAQISVSTDGAHGSCGSRCWDQVAMDLLDMSVTSAKGNRYVLVMVDCFSPWTKHSVAGQDSVVCGGCFLPKHCLPFRNAQCDSIGPRPGV